MMRFKTRWIPVMMLVAVIAASCTPEATVDSEAQTEQLAEFKAEISDIAQALLEREKALLEAREEIARQAREIENQAAREEKRTEAVEEALERLREAKAAAVASGGAIETVRDLTCSAVETELPADISDDFMDWIIETESSRGAIPDDLEITIVEAAGRDGAWAFFADFSARLEPGVFSVDARSNFTSLWGGMAPTESGIWKYLSETYPDGEGALAACLDLSFFVDT